jgi:hypothetical protein
MNTKDDISRAQAALERVVILSVDEWGTRFAMLQDIVVAEKLREETGLAVDQRITFS